MSEIKVPMRRLSRELALQVLFQREFSPDLDINSSLDYFREVLKGPEEMWSYARHLLEGVMQQSADIDKRLALASAKWSLSRMSLVDKNTLRIAIFEMINTQEPVPPKVAMNEAIEVARKYGNTDSAAFVNGILNEVAKDL
jgi:transcription antitermination protein NusB